MQLEQLLLRDDSCKDCTVEDVVAAMKQFTKLRDALYVNIKDDDLNSVLFECYYRLRPIWRPSSSKLAKLQPDKRLILYKLLCILGNAFAGVPEGELDELNKEAALKRTEEAKFFSQRRVGGSASESYANTGGLKEFTKAVPEILLRLCDWHLIGNERDMSRLRESLPAGSTMQKGHPETEDYHTDPPPPYETYKKDTPVEEVDLSRVAEVEDCSHAVPPPSQSVPTANQIVLHMTRPSSGGATVTSARVTGRGRLRIGNTYGCGIFDGSGFLDDAGSQEANLTLLFWHGF